MSLIRAENGQSANRLKEEIRHAFSEESIGKQSGNDIPIIFAENQESALRVTKRICRDAGQIWKVVQRLRRDNS